MQSGELCGDVTNSATLSVAPFVTVSVLLFARARELAGVASVSLSISVLVADELVASVAAGTQQATVPLCSVRSSLKSRFPSLAPLLDTPSTALTLNCEYVEDEASARVRSGDEVAVLPVVSGG